VCRSVLHISQDPIAGNGQRKEAFWECITTHYNQNKPIGGGERPSRSLETKWGIIKHDVAKFIGVHKQVSSCRESGSSPHDVLQNALKMSSFPTPQNSSSPPPTLYITSALPPYSQNKGPTVGRSKYKGPTAARPLALSSGAKRLVQPGLQVFSHSALGRQGRHVGLYPTGLPTRPARYRCRAPMQSMH
jgi:hypothetical protein